jgi:Carboxypeptidase regulatory-like domain
LTSRGTFIQRGWAAVLALAALLCLAAFAPAAATAGTISGTVTEAASGEPLEGVEVCAYALAFEDWACDEETASDGTYTLSGLFSGEYEVEFWSGGRYLTQFYDGKAHWWEADPVSVGTATTTTGIDAALVEPATIEGTVTANGIPVGEVGVCLWDGTVNEYITCEETDFDGSYAITGLDAGDYRVEFWPGWSGFDLAAQYFDHKFQLDEADPVTVALGETASGIDGELEPGAEISGTVTSLATGAPLKWIYVCAIEALNSELWLCTETDTAGAYSLEHLSQGQYKVVFSIDFEEWFGEEEGFEEDDGYPTQFWNNQTTLAAASVIPIATGAAVTGIDARLGPPAPPVAPPVAPPAVTPPAAQPPVHKPRKKKCPQGKKRKKVKGKVRCVKVRKRHRHRQHHHSAPLQHQAPFPGADRQLRHLFR